MGTRACYSIFLGTLKMKKLNLETMSLREVNATLQNKKDTDCKDWEILNPKGAHAIAVGLQKKINVNINGSTGYYCGGMNKEASITINGSTGPGVAENMMSGTVTVKGNASQYAGATARGGMLIVEGNASSRCGISMKGVDIVVKGNIGHMSCFMGQSGNLVVLGDAGLSLGDSIYEAKIFVRGKVKSLGADCVEKKLKKDDITLLKNLLIKSNCNLDPSEFKKYGSARKLYNFNINNVSDY